MVEARIVVGATIVDVFANTAVSKLPTDSFPGDRLPTERTLEHAAGERNVRRSGSAITTMQDVLAGVEGRVVNESSVLALENLPVAVQLTDVKPITQNVRQRRAVEARLALAEEVPFT